MQILLSPRVNSKEWSRLLDSKIELWCMNLAQVVELAKDKKGVIFSSVRQDFFNGTVDAKNENKGFQTNYQSKKWLKKNRVDRRTESAREPKNFRCAEGIQVYSTMSETMAAFTEGTLLSLKKILYRYMEDHGYKHIQKLPHLVQTLISREICSLDLISKKVKKSDIFFITSH